jgi:predicted acetyltransferase
MIGTYSGRVDRAGGVKSFEEMEDIVAGDLNNTESFQLGICLLNSTTGISDSDTIIGTIQVVDIEESLLSYKLHPTYWGRGYMSEALRQFLRAYFDKFSSENCVVAFVNADNKASAKVLEKCRFRLERNSGIQSRMVPAMGEEEDRGLKEAIAAMGLRSATRPRWERSLHEATAAVPENASTEVRHAKVFRRYVFERSDLIKESK